jgi:hypothetical protein
MPAPPRTTQITLANRPDWWDTDLQLQLADAAVGSAPAGSPADAAPPSQPGSPTRPTLGAPQRAGGRRRPVQAAATPPGANDATVRPWGPSGAAPRKRTRLAPPPVPVARLVAAPVQFSYVLADDTGDVHVNATTPDIEFLDVRLASGAAAAAAAAAAATGEATGAFYTVPGPASVSGDGGVLRSPRGGGPGGFFNAGADDEAAAAAGGLLPTVFSGLSEGGAVLPAQRGAAGPPAARVISVGPPSQPGSPVASGHGVFATAAGAAAAVAAAQPTLVQRTPSALSLSRQATSRAPSPGAVSSGWRSARGARGGEGGGGGGDGGDGGGSAAAGDGESDGDSEQDLGAGFETYPYMLQPALPEGEEVRGLVERPALVRDCLAVDKRQAAAFNDREAPLPVTATTSLLRSAYSPSQPCFTPLARAPPFALPPPLPGAGRLPHPAVG